jgi:hypothetical protein
MRDPTFPPPSFSRKEEENSADRETSANDFKQGEMAGGRVVKGAIKRLC